MGAPRQGLWSRGVGTKGDFQDVACTPGAPPGLGALDYAPASGAIQGILKSTHVAFTPDLKPKNADEEVPKAEKKMTALQTLAQTARSARTMSSCYRQ